MPRLPEKPYLEISIHALREEGDASSSTGGAASNEFLSTPSARRATSRPGTDGSSRQNFYPRPPRGGRHFFDLSARPGPAISIHALREEGDGVGGGAPEGYTGFLSTPSARRATSSPHSTGYGCTISIHALREEGDEVHEAMDKYIDEFLSTPSARRATCRVIWVQSLLEFLSTPSARRATQSVLGFSTNTA